MAKNMKAIRRYSKDMKVLAVEASSLVAGVAILDDSNLIYEGYNHHKRNHSQILMQMVENALLASELELSDIDIIAVTCGPGSFTGLRIGISTVKGLAQATRKKVAAVPTLDSLAHNIIGFSGLVCPIMDARRDQVYTSIYRWEDMEYKRLIPYSAMDVRKLANTLLAYNEPILFLGDGVDKYNKILLDLLGDKTIIAPPHLRLQRASSTAWVGLNLANADKCISFYELEPFYLRKSQAEQKKQTGKGKDE